MKIENNIKLKKRILDISYRHKLSHLSSTLSNVDIIKAIYDMKMEREPFILSNGHAGLAQYVVLEDKYGYNAEELLKTYGIHPTRDIDHKIYCSTGSLGHGLGITVGMALANRSLQHYCMISDGEIAEGIVYEAFQTIKKLGIGNIQIHVSYNGYSAYNKINISDVIALTGIFKSSVDTRIHHTTTGIPYLDGLDAHYQVLNKDTYNECINYLDEYGSK